MVLVDATGNHWWIRCPLYWLSLSPCVEYALVRTARILCTGIIECCCTTVEVNTGPKNFKKDLKKQYHLLWGLLWLKVSGNRQVAHLHITRQATRRQTHSTSSMRECQKRALFRAMTAEGTSPSFLLVITRHRRVYVELTDKNEAS